MNKLEREQMLQRRQALLTLMEGDFAPIEKVPVSKHVASAIWFKNAGLADILETYGLCCFRFKVFSGTRAKGLVTLIFLKTQGCPRNDESWKFT